jgi:hypothetical protein
MVFLMEVVTLGKPLSLLEPVTSLHLSHKSILNLSEVKRQ